MSKQAIILLFLSAWFPANRSNAQGNAGGATVNNANTQTCGPVTAARLREMLVQLGISVKNINTNPGKEKYEITVNSNGFDVPVGFEVSPSTNYVWLTIFLGKASSDTASLYPLLKQNAKIQPAFFYITESGYLMLGLPVDNRGLNKTHLRKYIDFIAVKVGDTRSFWKK